MICLCLKLNNFKNCTSQVLGLRECIFSPQRLDALLVQSCVQITKAYSGKNPPPLLVLCKDVQMVYVRVVQEKCGKLKFLDLQEKYHGSVVPYTLNLKD